MSNNNIIFSNLYDQLIYSLNVPEISGGPTGPTLWTPSEITTSMWFDADDAETITESGGLVSQWDDKSGNLNHATQLTGSNQPTYTTGQIQSLSNDFLDIPTDGLGTGRTDSFVILVGRRDAEFAGWGNYSNDGAGSLTPFGDANPFEAFSSNTRRGIGTSVGATQGEFHLWGFRSDNTNTIEAFFDGASTGSSTSGTFDPGAVAFGRLLTLQYTLKEVIFFGSTPSETDRQKLEGYLAHKWSLEGELPAEHPYKSSAPTI